MSKICFAILAHNNRECLEDLLLNLRTFAPASDVVLFNGGRDPHFATGLEVDVCPYSQALRYERVARFHFEVMRWLHEEQRPYDFLVTLDADMLLIKPGFEHFLDTTMADSAYMAVDFREIPPWTDWTPGRRYHYKWRQIWQPIFGTQNPYGCFNPGQVFRKEYAEQLMRFPQLNVLLKSIDRSRIPSLCEMVYATLAVTLDCAPLKHPASRLAAIRYGSPHSPTKIMEYLENPHVFLIHPVSMDINAPDRRFVRALCDGDRIDVDSFQETFDAHKMSVATHKRLRSSLVSPVLSKLRDVYLRLVPE